MGKHSFRAPTQHSRLPSTRYFPVARPPTRFVSAQMTVGLKEFYQRINEGKHSTLVNEDMDEDVFAPILGSLLAGRYKIGGVLGKGQSSIMIKAEDTFHPLKKHVAIKILHGSYSSLGPQEASCLLNIKKADTLNVSNTINILNVFSIGHHFCIVFELLRPRPLHEYFQMWSFSSKTEKIQLIRKIAFQIIQSLAVLSSLNIIHADIKPENILFQNGDENKVKIIDFGNALYCVHQELSLYFDEFDLQTIIYRAPEVMFGLSFGSQIDMWSLGCVLAECFLGKPLFFGQTKEEILAKMKSLLGLLPVYPFQSGKYFLNLKQFVGQISSVTAHCKVVENLLKKLGTTDYAFADFLAQLLSYDPSTRFDAFQAARHPFLAPECALGYFLPSKDVLQNTWRECSYSPLMLTPLTYLHRPKIDERIGKLHYSGVDLLHVGTKKAVDAEVKVIKVFPFKYKENEDDVSHGNKNNIQESTEFNVVSQENTNGDKEINVAQTARHVESIDQNITSNISSQKEAEEVVVTARNGYCEKEKKTVKEVSYVSTSITANLFPNLVRENKSRTNAGEVKEKLRETNFNSSCNQDVCVQKHFQPEKKRKKSSSSDENTDLSKSHSKERHTSKNLKKTICKKQPTKKQLVTSTSSQKALQHDVGYQINVKLNQKVKDTKKGGILSSSISKNTSKSSKTNAVLSLKSSDFSQMSDSDHSDDSENCDVLLM